MTKSEKAVFQLIETPPIDNKSSSVYSILALYSDGEVISSRFAYDISRVRKNAEQLLGTLQSSSPAKDEIIDCICELL